MKCPFCGVVKGTTVDGIHHHLLATHSDKVEFPLYVRLNEDGSKELLEEVSSATMLGADLQPLIDRCGMLSQYYRYPCLEPKGHEGVHKHFPWEWEK